MKEKKQGNKVTHMGDGGGGITWGRKCDNLIGICAPGNLPYFAIPRATGSVALFRSYLPVSTGD